MKLFQNLVEQIANIIDCEFGITDESGLILGCSQESRVGQLHPSISRALESKDIFSTVDGISFQKVYIKNKLEFIIFINSEDSESRNYLSLIAINTANIKYYFEEKFDKNNFFKDIILDNLLPGDASIRAKVLHIASDAFRIAFLIKTEKAKEIHPHEIIQSLFPNRAKDYIIALDDDSTVLIKELKIMIHNSRGKSIKDTEKPVNASIFSGSFSSSIIDRIGISSASGQNNEKMSGEGIDGFMEKRN
jgi:carbohydrate diacid regulator